MQLPNVGDKNQSCHILTVILIKIISYRFHSITYTLVIYYIQRYQFIYHSRGVHSGDTVLISNFQFETRSENQYQEIFIKGILFKIISKEYCVGNTEYDTLTQSPCFRRC